MRYSKAIIAFLCFCPLALPSTHAMALTSEQAWQLASSSARYKESGQRLFKSMEALKRAARGGNAEQVVDTLQKQWEDRLDSLIISTMLKDNVSLPEAAARCSDERSAWAEGVLAGRIRLENPPLMQQHPSAAAKPPHAPAYHGSQAKLFEACRNGNMEQVRLNVESRVDINSRDADGNTPLAIATRGGHADIVQYLLSRGADWRVLNNQGYPPAAYITDKNAESLLGAFVRHGLNINQTFGSDGRTLLHNAARSGYTELASLLLNLRQDPNAVDKDRETPLHYLAYSTDNEKIDRVKIARLLVQSGADINARNKNGRTPLSLAVQGKCQKAALALVQCGAAVNQKVNGKESLLYYAVDQEMYDLAGELIRRGASQDMPGDDWKGMARRSPGKLMELQKRGYLR